jgi:hypothetical protein
MEAVDGVEFLKEHFKSESKPINHDLQKAALRSFLSAQQALARECEAELIKSARWQIVFLPKYRQESAWLTAHIRRLAKELKQIEDNQPIVDEFHPSELESLFTPQGTLAEERLLSFRQRLKAKVLSDNDTSGCYKNKVETELFDQMRDYFIWEIKHNPVVHAVFETMLLTQMHATLQELVSRSSPEAIASIKLSLTIEEIDGAALQKLLGDLQHQSGDVTLKITRVIDGSVILVLQGSRQGIGQLRTLFKNGQLKEVSGSLVLEWEDEKPAHVNRPINYDPMKTVTKLAAWLQNIFSEEWLPVEQLALAPARARKQDDLKRTERGIQLSLGDEATQAVILVVTVLPGQENIEIKLRLYPAKGSRYLPSGLQVLVLDEDGNPVEQLSMVVGGGQDTANLSLTGKPGEQFTVRLVLGEKNVDRQFEI